LSLGRYAVVTVLLATCAGCGGASAADDVGKGIANVAGRNTDDVANTLRGLKSEGDEHSKMVDIFCDSVGAVVDPAVTPEGEVDWFELVESSAPETDPASDLFDRLDTTLTIAEETNPTLALRYARACTRLTP
jgi:hypothetical protein